MGRAAIGDILVKTGSVITGDQGGKDVREIVGHVSEEFEANLNALPASSERGRPPVGAVVVKVEGGYRRIDSVGCE